MRAITQNEMAMVSGGGEVSVQGGETAVVVISASHADQHSSGWMGQVEMAIEWLMGGGPNRFRDVQDTLPVGD